MRTKPLCYGFIILSLSLLTACLPCGKTIGGSITGLTGAGLVLQNNAADDLAVTAGSGQFVFAKSIAKGANYAVTVLTQPQNQTCTVTNGVGIVANGDVSDVAINCADNVAAHFLYVVNRSSDSGAPGSASVFPLDPVTGVPGESPDYPLGQGLTTLQLSPFSKFAYVMNVQYVQDQQNVYNVTYSAYSIYAANGGLSEQPGPLTAATLAASIDSTTYFQVNTPLPGGGAIMGPLVFHPSGKFVLSAYWGFLGGSDNWGSFTVPTIASYVINQGTGGLAQATGSPITMGDSVTLDPDSFVLHPSGKFAFAKVGSVSFPGNPCRIGGWSIDGNSGALSALPGSPYAAGTCSLAMAVHPSGNFVYLSTAYPAGGVFAYAINADTGAISASGNQVLGWDSALDPFYSDSIQRTPLNFDPSGRFAYIYRPAGFYLDRASRSSNAIAAYTVDPVTGNLTVVPGSPFTISGYDRINLAPPSTSAKFNFDPSGKFVFVTTDVGTVLYDIDPHSGALVKKGEYPWSDPGSVLIH
jgi:6-phosphogluconolactonase (cycloisomerase 2 family)